MAEFESNLAISQGTTTVLSEQEQRALASLGYTGGHVVAQQDDQPRRDIKETLMYAEQVHHCMHLIDHNEHAEAREILEGVIDALPDYSKAWGTLGVCLAQQKEYAAAEEHFRKALELDADQNFARIGLGRTLYSQGKLEECAEQLEIATILEPSALDAQYYLGEASLKLGRTDAARKAFQAALAISPGFTAAEVGLADVAREEGRFDEAAARYTGILSEDPTSAAAALGWARLLVTRGREAEAVQVFDELLRQSPNHVDSLLELAQLLATTQNPKLRDVSRSIELSERACELTNRREVAPLRALAAAYAADDRLKDAIQITEAALQLARDSDSESLVAAIQQELEDLIARRESVRTGGSSR